MVEMKVAPRCAAVLLLCLLLVSVTLAISGPRGACVTAFGCVAGLR